MGTEINKPGHRAELGNAKYLDAMISRFQKYRAEHFPNEAIDWAKGKGYVFKKSHEELNLFNPYLNVLMPPHHRHRWFRSMTSSQALAVSILGMILRRGDLDLLLNLICDDSLPLLPSEEHFWFSCFEFTPWWLEAGRRKSQIDFYMLGDRFRLAIECKLTEQGIGICAHSVKGKPEAAFSGFPGYGFCNRVKFNGAKYWQYWPAISQVKVPGTCPDECPLFLTYQLTRNVMAAAVNPATAEVDGNGAGLLLYDANNPSLNDTAGSPGVVRDLKDMMINPTLLRSASWQSLAYLLQTTGCYTDLLEFLEEKYGIMPDGSLPSKDDHSSTVISIDADPINADWIKVVHWDRVLSKMTSVEEFRRYLAGEGFTADEFRSIHYFGHLMKKHHWLERL